MTKSYTLFFITIFTYLFCDAYIKLLNNSFGRGDVYFTFNDSKDRGLINVVKSLLVAVLAILFTVVFFWSLFKLKWYYCLLIGISAEIARYWITGIIRSLEDDFFMFFTIPFIQLVGIVSAIILILSYF